MRAMVLEAARTPLRGVDRPVPRPSGRQVLVRIGACGVCRTDLHVFDGELDRPRLPLVLGHEIVGVVAGQGESVSTVAIGDRVGIPWLGGTCGVCRYCARGRENLCERAVFTGYTVDGGYAEYTLADERYCFPVPPGADDALERLRSGAVEGAAVLVP